MQRKTVVSTKIDETTKAALDQATKDEDRTASYYVARALKERLAKDGYLKDE